jgi:hypothetical protein
MATFTDRVRLLIDSTADVKGITKSSDELKKLEASFRKQGLSSAEAAKRLGAYEKQMAATVTPMMRAKAGVSSLVQSFGGVPMVAAAAASAVALFGAKAVTGFATAAVAAKKRAAAALASDNAARPLIDRFEAFMTKNDIPNVLNRTLVDSHCPSIPYPWPQPPAVF